MSDQILESCAYTACPTCGSCSGMYTANSMNCLTETIGMSLPGSRYHSGCNERSSAPGERGR